MRFWLATSDVDVPGAETLREWLQQLESEAPTQAICLRCADGNTSVRVYRGAAWVVRDVPRWYACSWRGEPDLILQGNRGVAGHVSCAASTAANALRCPMDGENWTLRMREEGDAIELSARSGRVSIKNIFQQAAVPPWQRERWPVLASGSTVVAVVGIATATDYRVCAGDQGIGLEWKPGEWKPA